MMDLLVDTSMADARAAGDRQLRIPFLIGFSVAHNPGTSMIHLN